MNDRLILESDANVVQLAGRFERWDGKALPASIAIFPYIYSTDSPTDFTCGQGEIDPLTGNFTATIVDVPLRSSKVSGSIMRGGAPGTRLP